MNQERLCNKCGVNKPHSEYRYRPEKMWLSRVCKQCERDDNKKLREKTKQTSLTLIDGKKLCTSCQTYQELKQFDSLDILRPKQCKACISCRKKQQEYFNQNKTVINMRNNKYYADNQPFIRKHRKEFRAANKETYNAKQRARYHTDYEFRFASNQRRRTRKLLGHGRYYDQYIGCDQKFFNEWIDYNLQFSSTMTRDNYGKHWHADHVFPCSIFTLANETHKQICFNWMNYTPLEANLNQSKLNRIDINQVKLHNQRLAEFLKLKKIEVVTWDPFNVLQQPQLPPFIGNNKDEQVEITLKKVIDHRMVNNTEDEESDYDSELEDEIIEKLISDSEIGNPQQVLPVTRLKSGIEPVVLQLDILDSKHC